MVEQIFVGFDQLALNKNVGCWQTNDGEISEKQKKIGQHFTLSPWNFRAFCCAKEGGWIQSWP